MARYKVILAYDGTQFQGYQRQAKVRTVQGVVEAALRELGWTGSSILAAGRTDTGVHADGQVIAFDIEWRHPDASLRSAMNAYLPGDVAVRSIEVCLQDFHPRYDARSRTYRYSIYCQESRHPLLDRYALQVWPAAELALMQIAAGFIEGTHDFGAFGTPPREGGKTVRTVYKAIWLKSGDQLVFEISANAFLYKMVRRLVSYQIEIGLGKRQPGEIGQSLVTPPASIVQGMVAPHGLSLIRVDYPDEG